MTPLEIEVILQAAFNACDAEGCPLNTQQRELLFRILVDELAQSSKQRPSGAISGLEAAPRLASNVNPLDELDPAQRQALLQFVQEQAQQNRSWKAKLLDDWLHDRNSGGMQFIRDRYGLQWLERVLPEHLAAYSDEAPLKLKVGDQIEVSNGLWEWVQEDGPCSREWFPCTVVQLTEVTDEAIGLSSGYSPPEYRQQTNCRVRFDNGMEYEIQGIYEWNRYNWRWRKSG
jgi:hypothetical protein